MPRKIERTNNIKVIKNIENPETPEILAEALIKISEALSRLRQQGNLSDDAIVCLICNMRGMGTLRKSEVLMVMDGLARLKSYYIRK